MPKPITLTHFLFSGPDSGVASFSDGRTSHWTAPIGGRFSASFLDGGRRRIAGWRLRALYDAWRQEVLRRKMVQAVAVAAPQDELEDA